MARDELFDDDFLRRLQRLGLLAKRISATSPAPGQRRGPKMGDGLEFADHRAYAAGDDLRFLDWHYYARMEKLLLRLFHEHAEGAVTLLLDCSASMALGAGAAKFDYARRMAAALAYVAMSSLDRVNIVGFAEQLGDTYKTGRNRGQILAVLDYLAGLATGGRTDLAASAERFAAGGGDLGAILILSDLIDVGEGLSDALTVLRGSGSDVVCLHVVDDADASPPPLGASELSAVESGRRLSVNVTAEVLASFRERFVEFARGLERTCLSRGATYVRAPTSAPFERLVLETLRRAGMLAT